MATEQPAVITRAEARALGLSRFFTGRPCMRGELAERYTSSGGCTCRRCLDVAAAKVRDRYKENPWPAREYARQWAKQNPGRAREATAKWARENPERMRAHRAAWDARNAPAAMARTRRRQAAKAQAVPPWFSDLDAFVIEEAYAAARRRTMATGFPWAVDHMIPLRAREACGLHVWNNIQVIPAEVNAAKGNRMIYTEPGEWLDFYGR